MNSSSGPAGWMSWSPNATILFSIYSGGADAERGANVVGTVVLFAGVVLSSWMLRSSRDGLKSRQMLY